VIEISIANLYLGVFFILRKKGIILVIIICFTIVIYGFISISNSLPKFIKDRSELKINYTLSPFDFRMDVHGYSFYANKKVIENIKSSSERVVTNIGDEFQKDASKIINKTSNLINDTTNVFKNLEDKIGNKIQNKVK
jgi:hypothetical protein